MFPLDIFNTITNKKKKIKIFDIKNRDICVVRLKKSKHSLPGKCMLNAPLGPENQFWGSSNYTSISNTHTNRN